MKLNQVLMATALSLAVAFGATQAFGQNDGGDRPQRNRPPGDQAGSDRGPRNFDPAEMQKRMMDRVREELGFTNDTDWSAVQPLVQKVMDARRDVGFAGMGMMGRGGRGGPGGGGRGGMFGQTSPEQEALQKAIEANAPAGQIKELLAKYKAAKKEKQAKLQAAQADLRKVLSVKQEAQATLLGLVE
jgi:hypothetical protein